MQEMKLSIEQQVQIYKIYPMMEEIDNLNDLKEYLIDILKKILIQNNKLNLLSKQRLGSHIPEDLKILVRDNSLSLEQEASLIGMRTIVQNMTDQKTIKDLIFDRHRHIVIQKVTFNSISRSNNFEGESL